MKKHQIATQLIHAGEPEIRYAGAVSMPVFQSSTFEFTGQTNYHDIRYIRLNNTPNHIYLHKKLATLENGEDALVTASGMAAISAALLANLKNGDHFLAHETLYGGTHSFINHDLPELGITCDFIDGSDPASWVKKVKTNTKLIYVETITNPLMEVIDLDAVVKFSSKNKLISIIDNTIGTSINYQPLEQGFDLSIHSATKYLNGHTDIVAGAVIGSAQQIDKIKHKLNHLGGALDPHACFLLQRGIKTLALRVEKQNRNALEIAQFLESHPRVRKVNYPGLKSSSSHHRAKKLLSGFGGMISFEIQGNEKNANKFLKNIKLFIHTASLGGVESLATRPSQTSHSGMSKKEREAAGIKDELIRLSIGIEDAADLKADLDQALRKSR